MFTPKIINQISTMLYCWKMVILKIIPVPSDF